MVNLKTKWYRFQFKWKQFWCPHYLDDTVLMSKTKRPDIYEDDDFVYTENRRHCQKCEAYVYDNGLETKVGVKEWLRQGIEDEE